MTTHIRIMATSAIVMLAVVVALSPSSIAQKAALSFEAATVKPGNPDVTFFGGSCHGTDSKYSGALPISPPPLGRCHFTQVTLKMLIQEAYGFIGPNADDMVLGGPNWMTSRRFTIEAKAPEPRTVANMRLMLRSLLQDRFKLKTRTETRELSGYVLVIGRNGPKLEAATGNEEKLGISGRGRGQLTGQGASIAQLTTTLAMHLTKPVVDETELKGTYNFSLKWTPGENVGGLDAMIARLPPEVQARIPGADPNGPSIFTAVQEQLGLRLDSRKVATEIVIIDAAESPAPN